MSQLFASGGQSIGVLSNVFKKNIYLAACGLGWGLRDLALWHPDFLAVVRGLRCSVARGILVPPPGMESVSPALQGRFLTIGPPRDISTAHTLMGSFFMVAQFRITFPFTS